MWGSSFLKKAGAIAKDTVLLKWVKPLVFSAVQVSISSADAAAFRATCDACLEATAATHKALDRADEAVIAARDSVSAGGQAGESVTLEEVKAVLAEAKDVGSAVTIAGARFWNAFNQFKKLV